MIRISQILSVGLVLLAGRFSFADPATTQSIPDVVNLNQLVNLYEPVPFDHKTHAKMAEMHTGCTTCHHRTPEPATRATTHPTTHTQADSSQIPACKSCHEISPRQGSPQAPHEPTSPEAANESGSAQLAKEIELRMPNLKGAYHRQCLNCHKEWMHDNACIICHKPRQGATVANAAPTPDDIVGRMHPPIPEPKSVSYKTRFTPVAGPNVLFRHEEHVKQFGLKCVRCHHKDTCSTCHEAKTKTNTGPHPLLPGKTWHDSHEPCASCHPQQQCGHCHFKDDQQPPAAFTHERTGQVLDKDHVTLRCGQCHPIPRLNAQPTCGDETCHKRVTIIYPIDRPGKLVTTRPTTRIASSRPTTAPTTKATIQRIRRYTEVAP